MLRAALTFLAALLLACPAPVTGLQRAITRSGEIIPDPNEPLDQFTRYDFSDIEIDPALTQLVEQLGSDEYAEREEATEALMEREFDREQLYALLAQRDLNAEQRHRLLSVVIEQLASTPRGAVGISMRWMGMHDGTAAVEVQQLIPGFDAARVLRLGDKITHVDGNRLFSSNDFGRLVQSKRPGDTVELTVVRAQPGAADEVLELPVKLGSLQTLKEGPNAQDVVQPAGDAISSEIEWAQARFGAPRRIIKVTGEMPDEAAGTVVPFDVDRHAAIQELQLQIEHLETGMIDNVEDLLKATRLKLTELAVAAREPGISDDERRQRYEVLLRYQEIAQQLTQR